MPPRARGGPALTLHWAALGTGVKECLGRLVTTFPPPNYHLRKLPGFLGPLGRSLSPLLRARPPGPGTGTHLAQHRCPKHAPHPALRLPRAGGRTRSSQPAGVPAPPWPPVAVCPSWGGLPDAPLHAPGCFRQTPPEV